MDEPPHRPQDLDLEALKGEALLSAEGIYHDYTVGCLAEGEVFSEVVAVIIIACVEDRFLVAVPGGAWHRKSASRKLPVGTLEKAVSASVAVAAENRSEVNPDQSVLVWLGWIKKDYRVHLDYTNDYLPTVQFVTRDTEEQCLPYAEALVGVADEKFGIVGTNQDPVQADRLSSLEKKFDAVQAALSKLLANQDAKDDTGFHTPGEEPGNPPGILRKPTPKVKVDPKPKFFAGPPGLASLNAYPGLDPGVVSAALQAGVPAEHLMAMSKALRSTPNKLGDYPRPNGAAPPIALLSDHEEHDELDDHVEPSIAGGSKDPMSDAVLKLTQIMSQLTKNNSSSNSLEEALDQVGSLGAAGSGDVSTSMGRKHAAARRALVKAFWPWTSICKVPLQTPARLSQPEAGASIDRRYSLS